MTTMSPRHKRKVEEKSVKGLPAYSFLIGSHPAHKNDPLGLSNLSAQHFQWLRVETTIMWARSPVCVDFGPLDPPPNEVAPFQRTVNDVRLRHKGDVASETKFGCLHRVGHVNTVLRQDLLFRLGEVVSTWNQWVRPVWLYCFFGRGPVLSLPAEGCQDRGDKCHHARRCKERFVREHWCQDLRRSQSALHAGADGLIVVTTERDNCSQESEPERLLDHVSCEHKGYTLACHGAAEVCLAQL